MGEFSTPNITIKEDPIEISYKGRSDKFHFPKQAGSFYHLSKVHDSHNIIFACNTWGVSFTDIMQGVVYGTRHSNKITDPRLATRLDFDESFGTLVNRYCCQAVIGHPLTPYGEGEQKRGFIALRDSIQCLTLAIENPTVEGEYRQMNQLDEVYSIYQLAEHVKDAGEKLGLSVSIQNIDNPRVEKEKHFYDVEHEKLRELGFKPTKTLYEELDIMLKDLINYKERIETKKHVILPKIRWKE
jgi:UDP-sulfoquinovose synthase